MAKNYSEYKNGKKVVGYTKPASSNKTNKKSSYSGSSSSSGSYYSTGFGPCKFATVHVSEEHTIELWGSSGSKLKNFHFRNGDLVLNVSYTKIKGKETLFKEYPEWMVPIVEEHGTLHMDEIHFEWPDMGTPVYPAEFWTLLADKIASEGYKRVLCCCGAGQGRTGTMLAILHSLFTGASAAESIWKVWDEYNSKAIETTSQEEYIFEILGEEIPPGWFKTEKEVKKNSSSSSIVIHSGKKDSLSEDEWQNYLKKYHEEQNNESSDDQEITAILIDSLTEEEWAIYQLLEDEEQSEFLDKKEEHLQIPGNQSDRIWENYVTSVKVRLANTLNE